MRCDQHPIPIYLIVLTQTKSGLTQLDKVGTAVLAIEIRYIDEGLGSDPWRVGVILQRL